MASQIIDGTVFNASQIRYTAPKANASGGKSVGILSTLTNGALKIQTPTMMNWGASDYEGNQRYELCIQFPTEEYENDETRAFKQNMIDFENKIKADALTNSKAWFGKQHSSPDVLEALWTPILKYPKDKSTGDFDKSRAPSLRAKIGFFEGSWKAEVYDEDLKKLFPSEEHSSPIELIRKGTRIISLIQCSGLWFVGGKFGVTWKLIQVVVPCEATASQGCLIQVKQVKKESEPATLVEDSDDEETQYQTEDQAEDIPGIEPAVDLSDNEVPEKKKRVVKKKGTDP
jgi:hypothetical protein